MFITVIMTTYKLINNYFTELPSLNCYENYKEKIINLPPESTN